MNELFTIWSKIQRAGLFKMPLNKRIILCKHGKQRICCFYLTSDNDQFLFSDALMLTVKFAPKATAQLTIP